MKIINLNMYGNEPKTFVATIEKYNLEDSDFILKNKITIMFYNILSALGYDRNKINLSKDIQIVNFQRVDEDDFILCTINIFNLESLYNIKKCFKEDIK